MSAVFDSIRERFSKVPPLLLSQESGAIKLELKPYLQPFEEELAKRELEALLLPGEKCVEEHGYWLVYTERSEDLFRKRLTYWQRVGRSVLEPTVQKALELTQNGMQGVRELHRSRRLRYGPHDIHEYRGKFFPQLVRSLITISGVPDGAVVLDPMIGSGTTACEAVAFGRSAIGADCNPLSVLISTVKATIPSLPLSKFESYAERWRRETRFAKASPAGIWDREDLDYLRLWFDPAAIDDLAMARAWIEQAQDAFERQFLLVCLSDIVRSVSWQKESDLRVRKEIRPYEHGTALKRFTEKVREECDRIAPYLGVLPQKKPPTTLAIRDGNAIQVDEIFRDYRGKVDLLVTSPPYATALPYLDTDRLSLIVLGLLPRREHRTRETLMIGTREITERQRLAEWDRLLARKAELPDSVVTLIEHIAAHYHSGAATVGFRRRNLPALLGKYFLDMLDAMAAARRMMRKGAHGYYVVGNNSTEIDGERVEIATDSFLLELGERAGWSAVETINMELLPSRDIFRENRGSKEAILCFRA